MSLTNFPNGITSFGSPVYGGTTDIASGNIYWVSKSRGSDSNPGTYDKPYLTIAKAITTMKNRISWSASPWAKSDRLLIEPGKYAENLTSLPYGCDVIGLGNSWDVDGERGVTIQPATGSPVDVTSCINSKIANICFAGTDTSVLFQADNFNRNILVDCVFHGVAGASPTTTIGFEVVKDMTGSLIKNCRFLVCKTGLTMTADNANSKQITGNEFDNLYVTGGDTAGIVFHVNSTPSYTVVKNSNFDGGSSTLALGADDNSTGELVHFYNCNFEATACDPASGSGHYNNCYLNGTLMT